MFEEQEQTHPPQTRLPHQTGPKDTPYEGGFFVVDIELGTFATRKARFFSPSLGKSGDAAKILKTLTLAPLFFFPPLFDPPPPSPSPPDDQYPFVPPKMKFVTKVWHPNISSASGAICLDVLKDAWSPALTLKTALLSLQALLASPEPGDPQDAVVARQYLSEPATWEQTARAWTRSYATREAASAASGAKVARLAEMGFPAAAAARALQDSGGDEQGALEALLSGAGA